MTDDGIASLILPTLTGPDGTVHTAARQARLGDSHAFLQALTGNVPNLAEGNAGRLQMIAVQVTGSRQVLLGMGFPAEVVDALDVGEAVACATRFFLAALQGPPTPPTP